MYPSHMLLHPRLVSLIEHHVHAQAAPLILETPGHWVGDGLDPTSLKHRPGHDFLFFVRLQDLGAQARPRHHMQLLQDCCCFRSVPSAAADRTVFCSCMLRRGILVVYGDNTNKSMTPNPLPHPTITRYLAQGTCISNNTDRLPQARCAAGVL